LDRGELAESRLHGRKTHRSRLVGGSAERERRSRLKGGCSQDWLPHSAARGKLEMARDGITDSVLDFFAFFAPLRDMLLTLCLRANVAASQADSKKTK
jgi:hypothetical protein